MVEVGVDEVILLEDKSELFLFYQTNYLDIEYNITID